MKFSYREDASGLHGWESRQDCGAASKEDLTWYYFPGNVDISGGGVRLEMNFGSVPALHFVCALLAAQSTLVQDGCRFEYALTEVDQSVWFRSDEGSVRITCSYAPGEVAVTVEEFADAVVDFSEDVIDLLVSRYPGLARHSFVGELRRDIEDVR